MGIPLDGTDKYDQWTILPISSLEFYVDHGRKTYLVEAIRSHPNDSITDGPFLFLPILPFSSTAPFPGSSAFVAQRTVNVTTCMTLPCRNIPPKSRAASVC